MIIERIEIKNFRSLKDVNVGCEELTVLLGRNGTGKSSLLYALEVFYSLAYQATPFDYFDKDTNLVIKIRVTFSSLKNDELEEFSSQLTNKKLIVTKVINSGGSKYYGASKQIPVFNDIRKLSAREKSKKYNELIDSKTYDGLGDKVRSAPATEEAMIKYETAHPEFLETFEAEQQFFGPKNIGGGKLDKYTKFVLVPAVRDAASETDKKGVILQLIDVLVMRSVNKRPDVRKLNIEFEKRIREVYSNDNLKELGHLAGMITELLAQYAPGAELDLAFGEIVPPKIPLPPAIASLVEDNFKCPISYTGHGLQRALIFALLQQLSLTDLSPEPAVNEEEDGAEDVSELEMLHVPDLILAIEEPELYLHPSRSRYLSQTLDNLSSTQAEENEPRTQILLATHSPYFISMDRFDRVRLARKIPADENEPMQCQISEYSRNSATQKLADITGKNPEEFTPESFSARAAPIMTPMVNEGFFADVVVVVEGIADAAILWAMQEILDKKWDGLGIVVVPAGGKNNIDRPMVIFSGLGIPNYFVFDGDSRHAGSKKEGNTIKSNAILLKLAGAQVEDFPTTQSNQTFTVFSDELETEIKNVLKEEFTTISDQVASEFGYNRPSTLLKNPHAATLFLKRVYDAGHHIKILEDIIGQATNLRAH